MVKTALNIFLMFFCLAPLMAANQETTRVKISIPENPAEINPMIYGQMLEDCNDKVIYGGLLKADGVVHKEVNRFLWNLNIPVVRWPGGTYSHEYDWKKGVGPTEKRQKIPCKAWGGTESNQFGTDEFLQWCESMGIAPYINLNMGNDSKTGGSLKDAVEWIEYVNAAAGTPWGKRRELNGRKESYDVKYWCLGNENYASHGRHTKEAADVYSEKFNAWAFKIRTLYPDLVLMGVGHNYNWNRKVLAKCGALMDVITLHFYIDAKIKDGGLQWPESVLFAPEKVEANIALTAALLKEFNEKFKRTNKPITIAIDEWNSRHQVFGANGYKFTRHDVRKQFDVALCAGMLNAFIRQSPAVSMANYIFPINGHGLVLTNGEDGAYASPAYFVFELYRKHMKGAKLDVDVEGPFSRAEGKSFTISGDMNGISGFTVRKFTFIDSAASMDSNGRISVAIVNRAHESPQKAAIEPPEGYLPIKAWTVESGKDINAANSPDKKDKVGIRELDMKDLRDEFKISPCGLIIVQFSKAKE